MTHNCSTRHWIPALVFLLTSPLALANMNGVNTADTPKTLHCVPGYITNDDHGNHIEKPFPNAETTVEFESEYHSASFIKKINGMDFSVYIDNERLTASIGYGDSQSSFGAMTSTQKAFKINLYFRGKNTIMVGNDIAYALTDDCHIE